MAQETPSMEWLDKERLLVERYRIKQETQRYSAEMVLRELELKQEAERLEVDRQQVRSSRDPLIIGVIAAAFGLLANALVASITARKEREISSSSAREERNALQFNANEQLKQTSLNNQAQRILQHLISWCVLLGIRN